MSSPFAFDTVLVFSWFSVLLLLGVVLRAKLAFLQRFLFPSCLAAGVVGLLLLQLDLIRIESLTLETFGYHFFNISFISMGLTRDDTTKGPSGKQKLKGPAWMALMQGLTFPVQAVVGGAIVIILGKFGLDLFPTFGFLVPLGFNEGPGQALSIGKAWESVGFVSAATIGLSFAAIGYILSFFVGVPLVNYGIRKGYAVLGSKALSQDFLVGILPKDGSRPLAGRLTLHSSNVETLAFQTALIGMVYGLTYLVVNYLVSLVPPDVGAVLWGFFFFFGLGVALLVRQAMEKAGLGHLVDPGIQRRLTGWAVDYLIVATVMAIQLKVVWAFILPIALIGIANGVLTTLMVVWLARRLPDYALERGAALFGTVTGTVSCGLLLLRIADPEFKTPVAFEVAVMNVFALPVVGGCTALVNAPIWWHWSPLATMAVFVGVMMLCFTGLKLLGLVNPRT